MPADQGVPRVLRFDFHQKDEALVALVFVNYLFIKVPIVDRSQLLCIIALNTHI